MIDGKTNGLIIYLNTGHGFKSPAVSISKSLEAQGARCDIMDLFKASGAAFSAWLWRTSWDLMLKFPLVFRLVFPAFNFKPLAALTFFLQTVAVERKVIAWLESRQPDFVVSTHFVTNQIMARIVRKYRLPFPFLAYNSDVILSHSAYLQPEIDTFFVSSIQGHAAMRRMGVPQSKLELSPFPIDEKYLRSYRSQREERRELGLKDMFTILLSFGGNGIGSYGIIPRLAESGLPVQIVVICGRNETKRRELETLKKQYPDFNLVIKGFVDNMQDYLYCCDLSAGKAGLNVVFESRYMKKPFMVLMAMANERHAARYVVSEKMGWWPRGDAQAFSVIRSLINSPEDNAAMNDRLRNDPQEYGSNDIARSILDHTRRRRQERFRAVNAVLFDMAGTLCDIPIGDRWHQVTYDGIGRVVERLDLPKTLGAEACHQLQEAFVSDKAVRRKQAKTDLREHEIKRQLSRFFSRRFADDPALAAALRGFDFQDASFLTELEELFVSTELDITVPFPETPRVVAKLAEHYPLYLVSNNVSRRLVEEIVEKCGVSEYFSEIVVSCDLGYRKPHKRFMDYVVRRTGVDPRRCVMVGDRLSQDILISNRHWMVGVYAAMVNHEDNAGTAHIPYTASIHKLDELPSLL